MPFCVLPLLTRVSFCAILYAKARCFCEKSNLYYQQHCVVLFLYFNLLDALSCSVILHNRLKLSSLCGGSILVCGTRHHYPHPHLLFFGNRSIYCKMEKRTLPWRILGAIFALCNTCAVGALLYCTYLFGEYMHIKQNSE